MNNQITDSIYNLMTVYNMKMENEDVPDNLKCVKCKTLLKNACQVPCGCAFCRICIDGMISTGIEFCPGLSIECKDSHLSRFATDYRSNQSISRLSVQCPNIGCIYVCQLVNMEDHLLGCVKKVVKCPFSDLGCKDNNLAIEVINDHFLRENLSHSDLLVRVINNIINEMGSNKTAIEALQRNDERNVKKINVLKHELVQKDKEMKTIKDQMKRVEDEINYLKKEKEDLTDRVRILSEKMELEVSTSCENEEVENVLVIDLDEPKKASIPEIIESNQCKASSKTNSGRVLRTINEYAQSINIDLHPMKSQMLVGPVDASFEWLINEDVGKQAWITKTGDCFSGATFPYKYQLESQNRCSTMLSIRLLIHCGPSDAQLRWPFVGTIVITVSHIERPETGHSITRRCRVERPRLNDWSSCFDRFVFSHFILLKKGVDLTRGLRISCAVVPCVNL